MSRSFDGAVFIRQRMLPAYRARLFDLVAEKCSQGCTVAAGKPTDKEGSKVVSQLVNAKLIQLKQKTFFSGVLEAYCQFGLKKILADALPDVFVTVPNPRMLDSYFITRFLRNKGVPCVALGIGTTDFWDQPFKKLRKYYRNKFLNQFDGFLCYGSKAARQYEELGIPTERIVTVFNSVVSRPSSPPPVRQPEYSTEGARVITIGRLIKTKGFDRLIRAAQLANAKGSRLTVWIVGDGPERAELERLAIEIGSPVEFFGRQTGQNLADLCNKADLFVLPGLGGLAIQESMAYGLPVIVTQADGTELDLVRENGWIIEKENVDALAEAMIRAIEDPVELRRRGDESFRIVRDEINLELMAERFVEGVIQISELGIRSS